MSLRSRSLVCSLFAALMVMTAGAAVAAPPSFAPGTVSGAQWDVGSVTGRLVARSRDSVTLRDGNGTVFVLRVNEKTRYVWAERVNPQDLLPGARVRAEVDTDGGEPLALALWVLAAPGK